MLINALGDTLMLLVLGLLGWFLLAKIHMPAPEVLGPAALIGALRVMQVDLPLSPTFIFPIVQVIIGIFIGSMLTRETVRELKPMALPAFIIIAWALSVIFVVGLLLSRYTALDLYTAMLSSSMGGLPEITIIGLASGASITVIILTQMLRLILTVFLFPVIMNRLDKKRTGESVIIEPPSDQKLKETALQNSEAEEYSIEPGPRGILLNVHIGNHLNKVIGDVKLSWKRVMLTLAAATAGGLSFDALNIPAGLLVGSMLFVAIISISGVKVSKLSPWLFDLLLVFIGINIADNITGGTVTAIGNPALLAPILIATMAIFVTSFGISGLIYRLTGWDYPTCFLAAAPGGFTMMTALAVKHGRDPLKVSMLHLCRLLSINLSLPFIFMILMN